MQTEAISGNGTYNITVDELEFINPQVGLNIGTLSVDVFNVDAQASAVSAGISIIFQHEAPVENNTVADFAYSEDYSATSPWYFRDGQYAEFDFNLYDLNENEITEVSDLSNISFTDNNGNVWEYDAASTFWSEGFMLRFNRPVDVQEQYADFSGTFKFTYNGVENTYELEVDNTDALDFNSSYFENGGLYENTYFISPKRFDINYLKEGDTVTLDTDLPSLTLTETGGYYTISGVNTTSNTATVDIVINNEFVICEFYILGTTPQRNVELTWRQAGGQYDTPFYMARPTQTTGFFNAQANLFDLELNPLTQDDFEGTYKVYDENNNLVDSGNVVKSASASINPNLITVSSSNITPVLDTKSQSEIEQCVIEYDIVYQGVTNVFTHNINYYTSNT